MVSTQDSESCDPGSSPGRTFLLAILNVVKHMTYLYCALAPIALICQDVKVLWTGNFLNKLAGLNLRLGVIGEK